MRRRTVISGAFAALGSGLAGCVRGPNDVEVGTPAPDQYVQEPLADCDVDAIETGTGRLADAETVALRARLLREIRRRAPVVRSDASGFDSLALFQQLFALADEASADRRGEYVGTDPVPADGDEARRAVAAKACLPQPTFVVHGEWILSVSVVREGGSAE